MVSCPDVATITMATYFDGRMSNIFDCVSHPDESLEDLEEFTSSDFSDLLGTLNSPGKVKAILIGLDNLKPNVYHQGTNFDNEGDEHESSRDDIGDDYDYDYDHERNTFKRRTVMEKDLVYDHNSGHTLQKLSEGNWIESIIPKVSIINSSPNSFTPWSIFLSSTLFA
jgi:hypothetical protein